MESGLEPQLIRKDEERVSARDSGAYWLFIILALILLALSVAIFSGQEGPGDVAAGSLTPTPIESRIPHIYTVSYKNGVFSPTNLRIHAGDTVKFRNDGFFPIRIVGDDNQVPGFDSVTDVPQGSSFGITFAARGIFGYHNGKNADETGTIMVR